jgi:hypothetical protein
VWQYGKAMVAPPEGRRDVHPLRLHGRTAGVLAHYVGGRVPQAAATAPTCITAIPPRDARRKEFDPVRRGHWPSSMHFKKTPASRRPRNLRERTCSRSTIRRRRLVSVNTTCWTEACQIEPNSIRSGFRTRRRRTTRA